MRYVLAPSILAVALTLSVGCSTDKVHSRLRDNPAELSPFLPNHELLVRQPDTFPFHYFYLDETAPAYEYVRIAPVDISCLRNSSGWATFDAALMGKLGIEIDDLRDFTRKAYAQAFRNEATSAGKLKVTDRTDLERTLVVEPAIIAIKPTKAELNVIGNAGSFVVPGLGMVASMVSSGLITVECRIRDAKTGKIVAMYADTESDPRALLQVAKFTWTRSTRINVKAIAASTAKVLGAKDYRTIRRDFPVRLISRIADGSL